MFPILNKALIAASALCLSTLAQAHVGNDLADHHALSLVDGLLHPFTGLDHLAAMLAVGFWSALSTRRVWLAPLAFANMLAGTQGQPLHTPVPECTDMPHRVTSL